MSVYDQFILFGDSLFQHSTNQDRGFSLTPALQAEYIRRLDVVNRGFSGYNTERALHVLSKVVPKPETAKVRFFVIFLGANDSCLKGTAGQQHVPLDRFKDNLKAIVEHPAIALQNPRVILVTPPPINEYSANDMDKIKGFAVPRRLAKHTRLYADAVKSLGQELNIPVVDLWTKFMVQAGWDGTEPLIGSRESPQNQQLRLLLHDGLHFTNLAYAIFFHELLRVIEETWPDQRADKLPYTLPAWDDHQAWDGILPKD